MMANYTDVQFIGYAIPSIPLLLDDIVDPPGFIEGSYIGIEPAVDDIVARIALAMKAVEQTVNSRAVDPSETTLKIFMMPEFSFRGRRGAYDNHPPDVDYFHFFRREFAKRVAVPAYEDWLFVAGTAVNTVNFVHGQYTRQDLKAHVREDLAIALAYAWQYCNANDDPVFANDISDMLKKYTNYCHADPVYEVTDKSYVVAGGSSLDAVYPGGLSIEKKYISNEDFVLNLYSNVTAEEECGYPPICENEGENKERAFDPLSIFTIKGIKFGLEVCLDHMGRRLRLNRKPKTEQVQIQLIPSCGMQIQQGAVIAGPGGLVFNCDGQYDEILPRQPPDADHSIWTGTDSKQAHTQLTQVVAPCAEDSAGAGAELIRPDATVTRVLIHDTSASKLFAYGAGEVHVYTKLQVPRPCAG